MKKIPGLNKVLSCVSSVTEIGPAEAALTGCMLGARSALQTDRGL